MNTQIDINKTTVAPAESQERTDVIDFKMVTFALAGKDYGVDIMNVKEIAKAGKFTYVPNVAPFLRGVYNLRGDIIPVVDLRIFFHLPAEKKSEDQLENMLILRVDEQIFGIIVDSIDKVVGINSSSIQPPHPIFGDINIKYIRGVVENVNRLYIILDVQTIFTHREEEKPKVLSQLPGSSYALPVTPGTHEDRGTAEIQVSSSELDFVKEALLALRQFTTGMFNEAWVESRFKTWVKERKSGDVQIKNVEEAEEFLQPFYSPFTDMFWGEDYAEAFSQLLPDIDSKNINVWNLGCGQGYETWSIACILRKRYPDARIKIWANDNDLLAISNAPNMSYELEDIPEYLREHMVKSKNAYSFNQEIKDMILFEYHDVLNTNPFPALDFVVVRDLLSFFTPAEQAHVFEDFSEKLKPAGLVFLGKNEKLSGNAEWKFIGNEHISAIIRK